MDIVRDIEQQYMKKELPKFQIGDTVDVHVKIKEGDKERVQIFTGTVIARKGGGIRETFTVRRLIQGEGVERTFPIHSPFVEKVEVKRGGKVRRAKLYYLRDVVGKKTKVKERLLESRKSKKARKTRAAKARAAKKEETEAEAEPAPSAREQAETPAE